jgi:hypothetical protein
LEKLARPFLAPCKQSFRLQTIAQLLESYPQCASADWIERLNHHLVFATWCVDGELARARTCKPSAGLKRMRWFDERKHFALSCALGSLMVKYQ